jgi:hypothetical protein
MVVTVLGVLRGAAVRRETVARMRSRVSSIVAAEVKTAAKGDRAAKERQEVRAGTEGKVAS